MERIGRLSVDGVAVQYTNQKETEAKTKKDTDVFKPAKLFSVKQIVKTESKSRSVSRKRITIKCDSPELNIPSEKNQVHFDSTQSFEPAK